MAGGGRAAVMTAERGIGQIPGDSHLGEIGGLGGGAGLALAAEQSIGQILGDSHLGKVGGVGR